MSDRFDELRALAPALGELRPDPNARVHYELMSGALIWSDEFPTPAEHDPLGRTSSMRGVFRFRTTLILGKPEERYRAGWELLRGLCPNWPGFLPERQRPDPALVQFYEDGRAKLIDAWEELDARYERQRAAEREVQTNKTPA